MKEEEIKSEFKDFIKELNVEITGNILNSDIKKMQDEYKESLLNLEKSLEELELMNEKINKSNDMVKENFSKFDEYNKNISEDSKNIESALREVKNWNAKVKDEIIEKYMKIIKETDKELHELSNKSMSDTIFKYIENLNDKNKEVFNKQEELLKELAEKINEEFDRALGNKIEDIATISKEIEIIKKEIEEQKLVNKAIDESISKFLNHQGVIAVNVYNNKKYIIYGFAILGIFIFAILLVLLRIAVN